MIQMTEVNLRRGKLGFNKETTLGELSEEGHKDHATETVKLKLESPRRKKNQPTEVNVLRARKTKTDHGGRACTWEQCNRSSTNGKPKMKLVVAVFRTQ
jgi:hypothetical protein